MKCKNCNHPIIQHGGEWWHTTDSVGYIIFCCNVLKERVVRPEQAEPYTKIEVILDLIREINGEV